MHISRTHSKQSFGCALIALLLGISSIFFVPYDQAIASSAQIIAHVGNEDITLQELENEFRSENVPIDQQQNPEVIRRVLSKIVVRKYLVQEATAEKLDREPSVLWSILRSQEQILSIAAIRHHVLQNVATRSIEEYIRTNPIKFANRKNYKVDQILLPANEATQSVIDATAHFNTLEEIEQKLNEMALPHTRSIGALSGSEVPKDIAERIEARKPEDIFLIRSNSSAVFFKIVDDTPLAPEQSAELAEHFIRRQLFEDEIRRATLAAREHATFEGDYARIMGKSELAKEEKPTRDKSLAKEESPTRGKLFPIMWPADLFEILIALVVGFAFGYGVRALRSRRRRTEGRKRYS